MARGNYLRSAPIRRLRHPLEESPLWGVLGSVFAGAVALVVGLPVLLAVCILIPFCLLARWLLLFIFWNRQTTAATQGGGPESVRGNDGRWLGSAWRYSVIHAVLIFEAGAGLDVTQLRNLLLTRVVPLYPRLTRRPVPLPLSAGAGHCWLPDSQFNIDRHVFAGPSMLTTEKQLQDYVGHLLGEGLPNDKPPWELHVLQSVGRHEDTVAVLRVHQSVADGMALVRVLCHSLADCQVLHVPQRPHFGALAFTLNIFRACLVGPLTLLFWLLLTTEDCNVLTQRKGWTGQVSVTWSAAITLPKVTRIKQVTRSTVNCVLLSALAGAARRLLQGCGVKQPPDIKIVLPVDLRSDVTSPRLSSRLGSKMAPVVVGLPVGVEGAVPRLWAMRRNLDSLRTSADPVVVYVATAALMATVPGKLARKVLSSLTGKASLQFSSLPGPSSTLLVGGHPLKGVYPLLPAQNSLGLAVSVFTYADQVYVAVISDSTLGPAASTLLHHLHCQIELLWQLLLHRRVPGESRSHVLLRRTDVTGSPVRELRLRLTCVQEEVQRLATCQSPRQQQNSQTSDSSTSEQQDAARLQNLKTEFSELLSELRRRNSAAVGGNSPLFEDEEVGGELWRPRRRAMSCSSSRRSSRSLVGLLAAARPASFIESYSSRSPTSPSSPIMYRPTTSERCSARPASYIDQHSTSSPLVCRAAASECTLPGAVGPISPEEMYSSGSRNSPVSPIKYGGHSIQHSSFCSTNITVISEHPSEIRTMDDFENAGLTSSVSTVDSSTTQNSTNIDSTSDVLQNKNLGANMNVRDSKMATKADDIGHNRGVEIELHAIPQKAQPNGSVVDIAHKPKNFENVSQTSSVDSSSNTSADHVDTLRHQDKPPSIKISCKKSTIKHSQHSPVLPPKLNTETQLKDSANPSQINAHSTVSTNYINNTSAIAEKTDGQISTSQTSAQTVSCDDFNAVATVNPEHSESSTFKGPREDRNETSSAHSSNLTHKFLPHTNTQCLPLHVNLKHENSQNQQLYSVYTTSSQAVINSNTSTIEKHNIEINTPLNKTGVVQDQVNTDRNLQEEVSSSILNNTTNFSSVSSTNNTTNAAVKTLNVNGKEDCVITLTMPERESNSHYEIFQGRFKDDCVIVPMDVPPSVTPILTPLSMQSVTTLSINIPEVVSSPSSSMTNSTVTGEHSIGYQIMESPDASQTVSSNSPKSSCSSTSITSTSSEKTLNSSSTFPPSTVGSPVYPECNNKYSNKDQDEHQ